MTNPDVAVAVDVVVATGALRQEATVWEAQSAALEALRRKVEGLRITGTEAGIFILMLDAYTQVVDVVSGRCGEGGQRTIEIASALRDVADVYDAEEQNNVHRMTGLY